MLLLPILAYREITSRNVQKHASGMSYLRLVIILVSLPKLFPIFIEQFMVYNSVLFIYSALGSVI